MATIICPACKKETILKSQTNWGAVLDGVKVCDSCGEEFEFFNNDGGLMTYYHGRRYYLNGTERPKPWSEEMFNASHVKAREDMMRRYKERIKNDK